jgi:hypothetical protein
MEIKKPTPQAIQGNLLQEFEAFMPDIRSTNNAEEKASQIQREVAMKKEIRDVKAAARNNDASGINEMLEANQTLTDQKIQVHLSQSSQDNFETPKSDIRYSSNSNEGSQKIDPSVLNLLDQNLLVARFAGPMIKKLG